MNYEKMIAVNRIESEQKIKLATMAIEQLIERGEYPSVTLLVKKTGLSRGFFYKNPEVRSRLDAAVQLPSVSCRRIWSGSKDSKNDNTEVLQMEIMEYGWKRHIVDKGQIYYFLYRRLFFFLWK